MCLLTSIDVLKLCLLRLLNIQSLTKALKTEPVSIIYRKEKQMSRTKQVAAKPSAEKKAPVKPVKKDAKPEKEKEKMVTKRLKKPIESESEQDGDTEDISQKSKNATQ
jgi:hypothetical protein